MDNKTKPKVKVTGSVADFKQKQQGAKLRHSNYFLTINTNQRFKDDDPNLENDTTFYNGVIETLLNNIDQYVKLREGDTWDDNVKDVNVEYVIEKGNEKNCLHCHIFLKFTHTTDVKLNYAAIKQKICQELGLKNIYMYNRISRGANENIVDYMNKYAKTK
jgi:hypothetical protein